MFTKFKYWILGVLSVVAITAGTAYALSVQLPNSVKKGDLFVGSSTNNSVFTLPTGTLGSVLTMQSTGLPGYTATSSLGVGGTPAGTNSQIQFNNLGMFGADAGLTYATTTGRLTVSNLKSVTGVDLAISSPAGATVTSAGRAITVISGDGGNTSGKGGDLTLNAGNSVGGNSAGGYAELRSGNGNGSAAGGDLQLQSGNANSTGNAGTINILGGTAISGAGGSIVLTPGTGASNGIVSVVGPLIISATTTLQSATTTINGATYFWPSALPVANRILQSNSSGQLSWVTDQSGGGSGATTTITSNVQTDGPSFTFSTSTTGTGTLKISGSGSTVTFALDTSGLQPAGSYITNAYASSTFPSFTYASSTFQTALSFPLTVTQGGTGTSTWQSGSVPFFNGTRFTENNGKFLWDSTNLWLKAPIADLGGQVFNVKAYGAKGDGTTNDTAAFTSAIAAAHTAGGGKVFLPTGNFKLSTSPTMFSDITIEGNGSSSMVTLATGAKFDTTGLNNIKFNTFGVNGNGQVTNDYGLYINNSTNVQVTGMTLVNMAGFGIFVRSDNTNTTSKITIANNYVQGQGNNDVIGGGGTNSTSSIVTDVIITGNHVVQDTRTNSYENAFDIVAVKHLTFADNVTQGIVQFGTEQVPHQSSSFNNNVIQPSLGKTLGKMLITMLATTSTSTTLSVTNNIVEGPIEISAGAGARLKGLVVSGNNVKTTSISNGIQIASSTDGSVTGNTITGATAGINFATSDYFQVDGNIISDSQYGIRDVSTSTTINIGNNTYRNITTSNTYGGNPSINTTIGVSQNVTGLTVTQNNTTNNPDAVQITNAGSGAALKVTKGNANNAASLWMVDTNQVAPAGNYTIGNHADALSFYRGVLGVSAAEKLQVNNTQVTSGVYGVKNTSGGVFGGPNLLLFSPSASSYINNGFNFGIGSTSPIATLAVQGTSTAPTTDLLIIASNTGTSLFKVASNGSSTFSSLGTGNLCSSSGSLYNCTVTGSASASGTAGAIQFSDGAAGLNADQANFVFDNVNKRLGIGTSGPITTLALGSGQITVPGGTNNAPGYSFTTQPNSGFYLVSAGNLGLTLAGTQTIQWDSQNMFGPGTNAFMLKNLTGDSVTQPTIIPDRSRTTTGFAAGTAGDINAIVNGVELTRWNATGFGIGSSTPTAMLTVQGFSGSTTPLFIVATHTGASYLTVASNGSTTLSSLAVAACDVKATATGGLYCGVDATGGSGSLSGGTVGFVGVWASSTAMTTGILRDNGTVAGVNATSSTVTFNIQGSGSLNPFTIASSTGSTIMIVRADGSASIGSGNVLPTGTASTSAMAFGNDNTSTGDAAFAGGEDNVASGDYAVALGINNQATSPFSVAIGHDNISSTGKWAVTLGDANVATGETAVAIGATSTASGAYSLAIGTEAVANATGSVALGFNSLAAGYAALAGSNSDVYGTYGVGLGYNSLVYGNHSTAIGDENTIGMGADNSTAIGSENDVLVIQSTAVGSFLTASSVQTSMYGSGASVSSPLINDSAYTLMLGSHSNIPALTVSDGGGVGGYSNIGIGTTTPSALLQVQGSTTIPTRLLFDVSSSTGSSLFKVKPNGDVLVASLISGNCVQAGTGGLLTTIAGACGSGGSGNSAWTIGSGLIYNATSTDLVGIGTITPTTTLFVQGNGGTNPFKIASSTGKNMLTVKHNGSIDLGPAASTTIFFLQTANQTETNGKGNQFTLQAGSGQGSGTGGTFSFGSGFGGSTGSGGAMAVSTGNAGSSGNGTGGDMAFQAGDGKGTGMGGSISFLAGKGGPTAPGNGGTVTFTGGLAGGDAGSLGGNVTFVGGPGKDQGAGGNIVLKGSSAGNIGDLDGGNILFYSGFPNGAGSIGKVGINSTTPTAILTVQGSSTSPTLPTFIVSSSSNTSLFQVAYNGSTTLSSLGTGCVGVSAGSLYTTTCGGVGGGLSSISALTGPAVAVATTSDTNITISINTSTANTLTFVPGWTGTLADSRITSASTWNGKVGTSTNLTTNSIPIVTGSNTIGNSSISQSAGTTLINGTTPIIDGGGDWLMNVIQTSGANFIVQTPTSTAVLGNTVIGGGVQQFNATTYMTPTQFCSGGLFYASSSTAMTIYLPTLSQIGYGLAPSPCTTSMNAGNWSPQFVYNAGSADVTSSASGTGETLMYAPGTGPTISAGQSFFAAGQFTASSTINGATTTGMSLTGYLSSFQPRPTRPSIQGQFLMASSTTSGANVEWTVGSILGTSPVTVTTSTAGQITVACATCVTNVTASGVLSSSGGTTPAITFTGILGVANGGTGANNLTSTDVLFGNGTSAVATSSNFTFTSASNTLNVSGTTTISNFLAVGTTTPLVARFTLQNAAGTTDAIRIASSSGATMSIFDYAGHLQIATTTDTANLAIQGTSGQTTALINVSSSTGASLFTVTAIGRVGIGSSTPSALFTVDAGTAYGTASTTVIIPQKFQIDTYNSAGTRVCLTIVGTTPTVLSGACP